MNHPKDPAPRVGRYEIKRGLGRGASSRVYLAYDPTEGRDVAIKVLDREFATDLKNQERFEREAKAMAALSHPNIVKFFDHGGSQDNHLFLVMEVIRGSHIGALHRKIGSFPETILAAIGLELASALSHAHSFGIIHRDLKPENVFLHKGQLTLADFGIVKALDEDTPLGPNAAQATEIIGTPGFMAPEQLQQQPLYPQTDVFALGALLYYLAIGKVPYEGDSPYTLIKKMRETRPTPLSEIRPEISEGFSKLVQGCLSYAPNMRPVSMTSVHEHLRDVLWECGNVDIPELLDNFVQNPDSFRFEDRNRRMREVTNELRRAIKAADGIKADTLRRRIGQLDPDNPEALNVTGMDHLVRQGLIPDAPEETFARQAQSKNILILVLLMLAGLLAGIWLAQDVLAPPVTVQRIVPQKGELIIQAPTGTYVFVNGRAIGVSPNLGSVSLSPGVSNIEAMHDTFGKTRGEVDITANHTTRVEINWKTKSIDLLP